MRILQIVTLVSPDGDYGGPVRVAENQCRALRRLGHRPLLIATCRGYAVRPSTLSGTPLELFFAGRLFHSGKFSRIYSVKLLRRVWSLAPRADITHVHLARDLVTLAAAVLLLLRRATYVVQPHGMLHPKQGFGAQTLDLLLVRPVLNGAQRVLYLTDDELGHLRRIAPDASYEHLPNGVPCGSNAAPETRRESRTPYVLYLSRLHPRKRPLVFVEAARRILETGQLVEFVLVGPDGGDGKKVQAEIARINHPLIRWEGPVEPENAIETYRRADVYVLPSIDEPFPMSVLEAMSQCVPVITTPSCGLASAISANGAGMVVESDPESISRAVVALLKDDQLRVEMGERAGQTVRRTFSDDAVAKTLSSVYASTRYG